MDTAVEAYQKAARINRMIMWGLIIGFPLLLHFKVDRKKKR